MPPGSPAGPVLAAWGITTDGKPACVGLAPGSGESAGAWHFSLTVPQRGDPPGSRAHVSVNDRSPGKHQKVRTVLIL
jgi:hypothetical protein